MKAIILNDTSSSPHAGCKMTMDVFHSELDRVGVQVLGTVAMMHQDLEPLYSKFEKADLIIVNGEGSIHHNNRSELLFVAEKFPCALVNCVFEANIPRPVTDKFIFKAARESWSAKELGAMVVPDVVYAHPLLQGLRPSSKVIDFFCFTDSVLKKIGGDIRPATTPEAFVSMLSKYKFICTGRFHGIVVCSALGIPFSTYASNTWKNEALMNDIGTPHMFASKREDAKDLLLQNTAPGRYIYSLLAAGKVKKMFEHIAEMKV